MDVTITRLVLHPPLPTTPSPYGPTSSLRRLPPRLPCYRRFTPTPGLRYYTGRAMPPFACHRLPVRLAHTSPDTTSLHFSCLPCSQFGSAFGSHFCHTTTYRQAPHLPSRLPPCHVWLYLTSARTFWTVAHAGGRRAGARDSSFVFASHRYQTRRHRYLPRDIRMCTFFCYQTFHCADHAPTPPAYMEHARATTWV